MIVILLISTLECTMYIRHKNIRKQELLEATIENINHKEQEIKEMKEKLEEYKTKKQEKDAQEVKINELEQLVSELDNELENKKQTLINLENE